MMAHEVESMFYTREVPWHGLGIKVEEAPTSKDALITAGLDWKVVTKSISIDNVRVKEYVANVRDSDNSVLGIVGNTYKIVQNEEAFNFTDQLLTNDSGVHYETAGSLCNGKKTWLLAKMPEIYLVDDPTNCYLTFMNSFDGKSGLRVFVTPVRVVCANTLNMALSGTPRSWSANHTGNIEEKLEEAKRTLLMASNYFKKLEITAKVLVSKEISDKAVLEFIEELLPIDETASDRKSSNVIELRKELFVRYKNAPDLKKYSQTQWALINAVSDFSSHTIPLRRTDTYRQNNFVKIIEGHPVMDRATKLLKVA
jgi:phage/plasmid-like protein (TIGR03299 family)